jgi:hypothetical protein
MGLTRCGEARIDVGSVSEASDTTNQRRASTSSSSNTDGAQHRTNGGGKRVRHRGAWRRSWQRVRFKANHNGVLWRVSWN